MYFSHTLHFVQVPACGPFPDPVTMNRSVKIKPKNAKMHMHALNMAVQKKTALKRAFSYIVLHHWFLLPLFTDSIRQKTLSVESNNGSRTWGERQKEVSTRSCWKKWYGAVCNEERCIWKSSLMFLQWKNSVDALHA